MRLIDAIEAWGLERRASLPDSELQRLGSFWGAIADAPAGARPVAFLTDRDVDEVVSLFAWTDKAEILDLLDDVREWYFDRPPITDESGSSDQADRPQTEQPRPERDAPATAGGEPSLLPQVQSLPGTQWTQAPSDSPSLTDSPSLLSPSSSPSSPSLPSSEALPGTQSIESGEVGLGDLGPSWSKTDAAPMRLLDEAQGVTVTGPGDGVFPPAWDDPFHPDRDRLGQAPTEPAPEPAPSAPEQDHATVTPIEAARTASPAAPMFTSDVAAPALQKPEPAPQESVPPATTAPASAPPVVAPSEPALAEPLPRDLPATRSPEPLDPTAPDPTAQDPEPHDPEPMLPSALDPEPAPLPVTPPAPEPAAPAPLAPAPVAATPQAPTAAHTATPSTDSFAFGTAAQPPHQGVVDLDAPLFAPRSDSSDSGDIPGMGGIDKSPGGAQEDFDQVEASGSDIRLIQLGALLLFAIVLLGVVIAIGFDGTGESASDQLSTQLAVGSDTSDAASSGTLAGIGLGSNAEPTPRPTTTPAAVAEAAPAEPDPTEAEPALVPLESLPPRQAVLRSDGILVLEGAVPSQEWADSIFAMASEVIGADRIENNYVVHPEALTPETGRIVIEQDAGFATNETTILPEFETSLELGVSLLNLNPELTMLIEGHTDDQGDPAYNRTLSLGRAMAVVEWLAVRGGIDATRLEARGYGSEQPIADNATEEGRALNRRIEVTIFGLLAREPFED